MRTVTCFGLAASLVFSMGCVPAAHAHRPLHTPPSVADSSPYRVELVGEGGETLTTFHHRGRHYVLGAMGQRYSVRVSNPTPRRVEVVLSIDGLDAVDGRTADFKGKRGYVLPAYGDVTIDGFRRSTENVAAFRFSSVAASYAGRKGQARNVGVIGVAFFAEREQPQVLLPDERYEYEGGGYDGYGGHGSHDRDARPESRASAGEASPPPRAPSPGPGGSGRSKAAESSGDEAPSAAPAPTRSHHGGLSADRSVRRDPSQRPGLGTEFGETRWSRVSYTSFERADPTRPSAFAELRYDNAAGLTALGIHVHPQPDVDDLYLRETANPFPGSGFAQPPGYR